MSKKSESRSRKTASAEREMRASGYVAERVVRIGLDGPVQGNAPHDDSHDIA